MHENASLNEPSGISEEQKIDNVNDYTNKFSFNQQSGKFKTHITESSTYMTQEDQITETLSKNNQNNSVYITQQSIEEKYSSEQSRNKFLQVQPDSKSEFNGEDDASSCTVSQPDTTPRNGSDKMSKSFENGKPRRMRSQRSNKGGVDKSKSAVGKGLAIMRTNT